MSYEDISDRGRDRSFVIAALTGIVGAKGEANKDAQRVASVALRDWRPGKELKQW
jgi:hypothetical protein